MVKISEEAYNGLLGAVKKYPESTAQRIVEMGHERDILKTIIIIMFVGNVVQLTASFFGGG